MRKVRGLNPAGGAVDSFFQSQELAQRLRPHMAKARWAEVVGPQVAGVTQVESVRDGVLFVRVRNSVWANELALLKDDMLRRLNAALGGRVLTDIHFKASGLARAKNTAKLPAPVIQDAPTTDELARLALPPTARLRVQVAVANIADDELRERITRAMLRAALIDEWKRGRGWLPCARCGALASPLDAPVVEEKRLCGLCRAGVQ